MKALAYIRVSTDGQVGEDKFGMEAQKEQILDYCARNNYEIIDWVYDEGESGAKERPGFDNIIYGETFNPPVECVIVAKSDRVARDINIYYYYKMMLTKKNIKLISISENFGQFGVFANMLEAFTLCVAEMERNNITKRTSSGRKIKASGGGYSGGRPPYGYEVSNGNYVIKPDEAEIVRKMFEYRNNGMTFKDISEKLMADGVGTRYEGAKFTATTVKRIIDRERLYRGEYRYGEGEWVKGQHEPILTDDD